MKTRATALSLDDARQALDTGTGAGVRIAIIDSGVEVAHPDLKGLELVDDIAVYSDGVQLQVVSGEGQDVYGHGTAIAEVIRRIAPEVSLGSFRVLNGDLRSRTAIIREGVRQAIDLGYDVLNCSFGCPGTDKFIMQYKDWIDEAYLRGIHVVSACNNQDFTMPEWPGYFPSVITVNMARSTGLGFYYSPANLVEFAAPGHELELAWRGGTRRAGITGSSYAAPHVAGLLARILSVFPGLPPLEAKAVLHRLAQPFEEEIAGTNVRVPA
ncbi:MAG TPA: S8 family serine peptidase [Longimicrobiales bacterium]|nr:S8 family serine peptidase [Longimicrobiales bacterium]